MMAVRPSQASRMPERVTVVPYSIVAKGTVDKSGYHPAKVEGRGVLST